MDSIDGIRIEADERGFELVLTGDFTEACARYLEGDGSELRLNMQAAAFEFAGSEGLRGLLEWWAEGESMRRTHERLRADVEPASRRAEREVFGCSSDDPEWAERVREGIDLARKAERERS